MQDVAREMNLSETAFLTPHDGGYNLRWFTPTVEVDLCGHATAGQRARAVGGRASAGGRTGALPHAQRAAAGGPPRRLDRAGFPGQDGGSRRSRPPALLAALGLRGAHVVGRNAFDYLVEVDSEEAVRALAPDFTALRKIDGARRHRHGAGIRARGSISCRASSRRASGIDEDPVTGSAHCALGPYWGAAPGQDAS